MTLFQLHDEAGLPVRATAGASIGEPDLSRERNACDQWTLVKDANDDHDYVVQEHVRLDALLSGKPYLRLIRRMTIAEFLATDQPAAVKRKLQTILDERAGGKS